MSHIRFNHVFISLMFLAALAVFVIPQRISAVAQGHLQFLFAPIARPVHALAGWTHDKFVPPKARDDASPDHPRTSDELLRENSDLRQQMAVLTAQMDQLKELNEERKRLGPLRDRSIPVGVDSVDSGTRESLQLSGGSQSGLREKMVVLSPDGVVGRITQVGLTSSRVQLITDKGQKVTVSFLRFEKNADGSTSFSIVSYPSAVAVAQGNRRMIVNNRPWNELKGVIRPNDWAVLDDPDWPRAVMNYRVARVSKVVQQPAAPGFGEIHLESVLDLTLLKEVMVLAR